MARAHELAILIAGALLMAAAPASADGSADGGTDCGSSAASPPPAACQPAPTSFDLATLMTEIMQLQQQEAQTYAAEARAQLSAPDNAYAAAQQAARAQLAAALAGSAGSTAAGAISQHPAGALMAHVPGGGPLSGTLVAQPADQRP
jgi:hypothetical protein